MRLRHLCLRLVSLLLLFAALPRAGPAQEMRSAPRALQVEVWGGLARNSPRWGVLGDTPAMDLALFAVRIARPVRGPVFVGATRSTLWHVDLIPLALISPPYVRLDQDGPTACDEAGDCLPRPRPGAGPFSTGAVLGAGINPLGITTRFRQRSLFSPSVGVTTGVLFFERAVPTRRASAFNFTAAVELGLRIGPPDRRAISLAYRLHHISNGSMADENPALASHLFTVGLVSPVRAPRHR